MLSVEACVSFVDVQEKGKVRKGRVQRYGQEFNPISNRPSDLADISRITDRVYLGQYRKGAGIKTALHALGITHILSVGNDLPPFFPDEFTYKVIHIDDAEWEDISKYFGECLGFMTDALEASPANRVLVHCWAGISRSATIITAYLMYTLGYNYVEALEHMRKARHWTDPNKGFRQQLVKWNATLLDVPVEGKYFQEQTRDWKLYLKASKTLRTMHREHRLKPELIDQIIETYVAVFGQHHPFTLQIRDEVEAFAYSVPP